MDFYKIKLRQGKKKGEYELYPDFVVRKMSDLLVLGHKFYAVWCEDRGLWSTDMYDVQRLVDEELSREAEKRQQAMGPDVDIRVRYMNSFSTASWREFQNYIASLPDSEKRLDEKLTFLSDKTKKSDYASKRLNYDIRPGDISAYDEMMNVLYAPDEREKLEWAIGSILAGDSRDIQKFIVLYGDRGTGKSTVIDLVEQLFKGYCSPFDAKSLGEGRRFCLEPFKDNPMVAIQHDGDLSRIEDNTILNSIVSHEQVVVDVKSKNLYSMRPNSFLFMGTNTPVKITDAKSGLLRRLIVVKPTGEKIPTKQYFVLKSQIKFELGAIADHCLRVYRKLGKNYYQDYIPTDMMYKTDVFFNFVEDSFPVFSGQDGVTLKAAYAMYKSYCEETAIEKPLPMYKFREELKDYFREFKDMARLDGKQVRSYYQGFLSQKFKSFEKPVPEEHAASLAMDSEESLLDELLADCKAQYAGTAGKPPRTWKNVTTKLRDLDTHQLHYVLLPESMKNLITIDFDLKDENGKKDAARNMEAASKWPATYAEYSKSGEGIHLHYFYDGDISQLNTVYEPGIEQKVHSGLGSLRRCLSRCNRIPIAHISSGLKLKETKMVDFEAIKDEKHLRNIILKALRKETAQPYTTPCVSLIKQALDEAYASGMAYDVSDLYTDILKFANSSSHQALTCIRMVNEMHFTSKKEMAVKPVWADDTLVFFDIEVFINLLLICWKAAGPEKQVCHMINPKPEDIEELLKLKLIGFNCRKYDNYILWARMMGYSNEQLYHLSQRLINSHGESEEARILRDARNASYTDILDFSSKKQSLKKFEIELDIHHQELNIPWDKPVPDELIDKVIEYCENDVRATEALFFSKERQEDWHARNILADVAGLTVNDTTNSLTTRIIFGTERKPQGTFHWRDMGHIEEHETYSMPVEEDQEFTLFGPDGKPVFPGYKYDHGVSTYRGEEVGEGGYVYAEPDIYTNVALLDIASMHPSSIVAEQLFGPQYTKRFEDIMAARVAAKHFDKEAAAKLLDGKLLPYMTSEEESQALSGALKIAINSVYGLTAAKFDNPFRDPRNVDNIVAKRGALFMVNLKHLVQQKGFTVAHIKTDSIKIPNATPEIIQFVKDYGKLYGYTFEHEATYEKMCLVNDAVYIARYDDKGIRNKGGKHAGEWTATGAQFQHPYVFKTLFTHEPVEFRDMCETKSVSTSLYLDMNEGLPDVTEQEKELKKLCKAPDALSEAEKERMDILSTEIAEGHSYRFVGRVGSFCPVKEGRGGGLLVREKDGKYNAATGAKGYRWMESEMVKDLQMEDAIDRRYFDRLANEAKDAIGKYGDFEIFASDEPYMQD